MGQVYEEVEWLKRFLVAALSVNRIGLAGLFGC